MRKLAEDTSRGEQADGSGFSQPAEGSVSEALLQLKHLSCHFTLAGGQVLRAVDDVSLDLYEGEVLGLVGESGSGKSTLGKTVVGLNHKTAGEVLFEGKTLPKRYRSRDFRAQSQSIQMIFQEVYSALSPRMTGADIVAEGLKLSGRCSPRELREGVLSWLLRVGLSEEHLNRYPHEFSGGQRQRLGIARALALQPRLLICDEPVSALDVSVQAQIVNLLSSIRRDFGISILFIAHDLSMVRYISDRIAVMYLGRLVEVGPARQVFDAPAHPYTQALLASNPVPDPAVERQRRHEPIRGEVRAPIGEIVGCRFADRCPLADAHCRQLEPVSRPYRQVDWQVACHKA
jgi:oligopeptide/dipeptide ABC transporter ATP-binding protein